jgi:hypothetical protein
MPAIRYTARARRFAELTIAGALPPSHYFH